MEQAVSPSVQSTRDGENEQGGDGSRGKRQRVWVYINFSVSFQYFKNHNENILIIQLYMG